MNNSLSVLRRKEVEAKTGLFRSTLYELIADGRFPKPVRLTDAPRRSPVGWIESEVNDWIAARIEKRDAA